MKKKVLQNLEKLRIGVITAGGDCGGLNAAQYAAIMTMLNLGYEPIVIPGGNIGLYNLIDYSVDEILPATVAFAESIDITRAGSEIGNTRIKIKQIDDPESWERVLAGIKKHRIDGLIVIGGDGTGRESRRYIKHGIPCVHVPKTMDLDLQSLSVGADSAINKLARIISDAKTTGESHNRVLIIEVFGANTGHIALCCGVGSNADAILIPEVEYDLGVVYRDLKRTLFDRFNRSSTNTGTYVIVVAEGLKETEQRPGNGGATGAGASIATRLKTMMKEDKEIVELMKAARLYVPGVNEAPEIRDVVPLYIARSGETSALDVNFGLEVGAGAVYALSQGLSGVTILGFNKGTLNYMKTKNAIERRYVDDDKVKMFENMGFCFGRPVELFEPTLHEVKKPPERLY